MSRMTKTPLVMLISGMLLGTSAYAEDKLTVVSWGGAFTKSQVEAYHKPFIQKTGVEIVSEDFSGGLAEIKAQVEANNVRWDLVSLDKPDIVRGCAEGLWNPSTRVFCLPALTGHQQKRISSMERSTSVRLTPSSYRPSWR